VFRREATARPVGAEFERLARIATETPSDLEARVKHYLTEQSRRDVGRRCAPNRRGGAGRAMIRARDRYSDDVEHKSQSKVALLMMRYMRAFDAVDGETSTLAEWAAAIEKA
jgi:hypothetical protein